MKWIMFELWVKSDKLIFISKLKFNRLLECWVVIKEFLEVWIFFFRVFVIVLIVVYYGGVLFFSCGLLGFVLEYDNVCK